MKRMLALAGVFVLCAMVAGAEEKKFKVDDEGFIRNWLVLDPIQLDEKAGTHEEDSQKEFFNKEHFKDQKKATPKEGDKVKVGEAELKWNAKEIEEFQLMFEEKENIMSVAVTYVVCEADIEGAQLSIGSDDSSLWLLNGKETIRVYSGRGVEKDQNKAEGVKLNKGVNVLYGAVINGGGPTGLCARFLDKEGNPLKNISVSLTPPPAKEKEKEGEKK